MALQFAHSIVFDNIRSDPRYADLLRRMVCRSEFRVQCVE
jgi:hypothetical protein